MAVGVIAAGLVGVLTGLFSLRFRRLQFAIISLAFGSVIGQFLLTRHELTSNMAAPSLFGFDLLKSRNAYVLVAILALVAFVATSHLKRSTWGLQVAATRELQSRIGHFGLSPLRNELVVFCFSAMVAGLAGCAYPFIANLFNAVQFSPLASVSTQAVSTQPPPIPIHVADCSAWPRTRCRARGTRQLAEIELKGPFPGSSARLL